MIVLKRMGSFLASMVIQKVWLKVLTLIKVCYVLSPEIFSLMVECTQTIQNFYCDNAVFNSYQAQKNIFCENLNLYENATESCWCGVGHSEQFLQFLENVFASSLYPSSVKYHSFLICDKYKVDLSKIRQRPETSFCFMMPYPK